MALMDVAMAILPSLLLPVSFVWDVVSFWWANLCAGKCFPVKEEFNSSHSQILFRLRDPMICMLDYMCQWLLIHSSTYMSIKGGSGFVIGFQTVGGTMVLKWEECRPRWLLVIRNKGKKFNEKIKNQRETIVQKWEEYHHQQHQDAFLYWFKNLGAEMARRGRQTENVRGVSSKHGYH